jgi:hypothetical protein
MIAFAFNPAVCFHILVNQCVCTVSCSLLSDSESHAMTSESPKVKYKIEGVLL